MMIRMPKLNKPLYKGFTLLELIVVIVIIGVLATLGFTQYNILAENARGAEAKANLGVIRKLNQAYYLANNTSVGITGADLNIGSGPGQFPTSCDSSHYFAYSYDQIDFPDPEVHYYAQRCISGGKSPQNQAPKQWALNMFFRPSDGYTWWGCLDDVPAWHYKWQGQSPAACP